MAALAFTSSHRREEHVSDGGDGGLEAEVDAVVDGLRAHNTALLGEQLEPSQGSARLIILDALQVLLVHDDVAGDVLGVLAFETLHLRDDHFSVLGHSFVLDGLDHVDVALSAADENLSFHELDKTLDEEVLEKLLIGVFVAVELFADLLAHLLTQVLDVLIDFSHALDTLQILLLGLLDLQADLLVGKFVLEVLRDLLLFFLDVLVLLDGELVAHRLLDARDLLVTVLLDELDHRLQDFLRLNVVAHF
eukprot:CAMPEP_0170493052 /NCGR_PEP_ID=MMETSP0208-20121228/13282_1 /TAXON_ID=197538 /ORGANISM="Strombidium inclinatum, Strain S3" /LENGTH=248 /DNA_ID=CAMNT_0010768909 /DNA_START=52 /DNA_END=796 /DNA_ORIENTATION=-